MAIYTCECCGHGVPSNRNTRTALLLRRVQVRGQQNYLSVPRVRQRVRALQDTQSHLLLRPVQVGRCARPPQLPHLRHFVRLPAEAEQADVRFTELCHAVRVEVEGTLRPSSQTLRLVPSGVPAYHSHRHILLGVLRQCLARSGEDGARV